MRKSRLALLALAVAPPILATVLPEVRLGRASEAARRAGMGITLADLRVPPFVTPGFLPSDLAKALAARRREFSVRGKLPGAWFREGKAVRALGRRLIAEGRVHEAARFAALVLQEPTFVAAHFGGEIAQGALAADPAVDFGPTPDFHELLQTMMLEDLEETRLLSNVEGRRLLGVSNPTFDVLHARPRAALVEAALLDAWRTLLRELPADPDDLEGAARVLDRRFPAIDRQINGFFVVMFSIQRDARLLRPLVELRNARRKALYAGKR